MGAPPTSINKVLRSRRPAGTRRSGGPGPPRGTALSFLTMLVAIVALPWLARVEPDLPPGLVVVFQQPMASRDVARFVDRHPPGHHDTVLSPASVIRIVGDSPHRSAALWLPGPTGPWSPLRERLRRDPQVAAVYATAEIRSWDPILQRSRGGGRGGGWPGGAMTR
ncbi:MAG: hypothetical protein AAGD06_29865 [Acidobacteriota bacterium]